MAVAVAAHNNEFGLQIRCRGKQGVTYACLRSFDRLSDAAYSVQRQILLRVAEFGLPLARFMTGKKYDLGCSRQERHRTNQGARRGVASVPGHDDFSRKGLQRMCRQEHGALRFCQSFDEPVSEVGAIDCCERTEDDKVREARRMNQAAGEIPLHFEE